MIPCIQGYACTGRLLDEYLLMGLVYCSLLVIALSISDLCSLIYVKYGVSHVFCETRTY